MPNFSVVPVEEPSIPRSNLLFWFDPIYQFNSPDTQTSFDRSGNFGSITFSNSPNSLQLSDALGGLDFNGTNQHILTPLRSPVDMTQATWVAWIRRRGDQAAYAGIFFNRPPGGTGNIAGIHFADTGATVNRLRYTWNNQYSTNESNLFVPDGKWVMVVCSYDGTGATWTMAGSGSSIISTRVTQLDYGPLTFTHSFISYDGTSSRYFKGSIGMCLLYSRVLTSQEVTNIYNNSRFRFESLSVTTTTTIPQGGSGEEETPTPTQTQTQTPTVTPSLTPGLDSDAQAFILAAGSLTPTEESAIITLVASLKSSGIWSGLKVFYPFVGTTAQQHKLNLINPSDTDAAFRLTFHGEWLHTSSGLVGNGSNSWAETHFEPAQNTSENSPSLLIGVHAFSQIPNTNPSSSFTDIQPFVGTLPWSGDIYLNHSIELYRQNGVAKFSSNIPTGIVGAQGGDYTSNCVIQNTYFYSSRTSGTNTNAFSITNCSTYNNNSYGQRNFSAPAAGAKIVLGKSSLNGQNNFVNGQYSCFFIGANGVNFISSLSQMNTICKTFASDLGRTDITITPSVTPTNTPTPSITPTNTPSNTVTPSVTPSNTVTPSITSSNQPTPSITPTNTPSLQSQSPWTPAQITTALWLDADDATTITLNGTNVSQWNDKSGNGRNATQPVSSRQPARTLNGLNGKTVLTFGNNIQMESPNGSYGTNISIFSVARLASGGGYQRIVNVGNSQDARAYLGTVDGNFATFFGNGTWNDINANSPSISLSSTRILGVVNPTSGSNATPYVDGTAQNTKIGTMTTGTGIRIGSAGTILVQFWVGPIAEIIIINSAVTVSTRQTIEGYLAWKWGLQSNLPADHPYKNSQPTI